MMSSPCCFGKIAGTIFGKFEYAARNNLTEHHSFFLAFIAWHNTFTVNNHGVKSMKAGLSLALNDRDADEQRED